jgi:hypothetical protein
LAIFVEEAHHAFGKALAKDLGIGTKESDTSLRTTIDILAASLNRAGTRVVACYNFTGTPYVGREVLPEVVYAYGLKEAIEKAYLKKVVLHGYTITRSDEFVDIAVENFLRETSSLRPEGMLPKLALFATTIEEVKNELRPALEKALERLRPLYPDIPADPILVNVGDEKLTSNDEIREFNRLDTDNLQKLPLDQLKIDQSFVRNLSPDPNGNAIVRTIIAMAKGLNVDIIAEGVETEEEQQLLHYLGCDHYQGYLFRFLKEPEQPAKPPYLRAGADSFAILSGGYGRLSGRCGRL